MARLREENDEFTFIYLNAETAIGFTNTIYCDAANVWTEAFCIEFINNGATVKEAVDHAAEASGLTSAVICGNENLIFQDIALS